MGGEGRDAGAYSGAGDRSPVLIPGGVPSRNGAGLVAGIEGFQRARVNTPNTWSDEHVEDALRQMTEASLTVLPVLDRDTKLFVGGITSQEIVEFITSEARGGE